MIDLLLFNLVAIAAALLWTLHLRVRPLSLAPAAFVLTHMLVITAWVLGSGWCGVMSVAAWRIIATVLVILMIVIVRWRRAMLAAEWTAWRRGIAAAERELRWWRIVPVALALAAMATWLVVDGYMVGPYLPDVMTYHLTPATTWVIRHRVFDQPWIDTRCWWPQGQGVLAAWWMTPTHLLRAAVWAELDAVVMAWAVAWGIARQIGGSRRAAWWAVAATMTVPMIWAQGISGVNDLTCCVLALAALIPLIGRRVSMTNLLMSATALMLGLAVKPTMLLLAPVIVLAAIARIVMSRRRRPRKGHALAAWCITALLALGAAGYWYGRTAIAKSNPMYPATIRIAGHTLAAGDPRISDAAGKFSVAQFSRNIINLTTDRMWDRGPQINAQTERSAGFGWVASALGLIAMVWLFVRRRRSRWLITAVLLMVVMIAAGTRPDLWNGRFFGFAPIVLAALAVMLPDRWRGRMGMIGKAVWALAVLVAAGVSIDFGVVSTMPVMARTYWNVNGYTLVPPRLLNFNDHAYLLDVAAKVPPDATLAVVGDSIAAPLAPMHGEHLTRRLIMHPGPLDAATIRQWQHDDVRWVITAVPQDDLGSADQHMRAAGLIHVEDGLYRVP